MAKCPQTLAGISLDCTTSQGGIKKVWIADINGLQPVLDAESKDKVTFPDEAQLGSFKAYEFRRGTASMTSTLTRDETTGVNYVTTELSLVFTKQDTQKRIEMAALSIGQLACIVEDSNGVLWYLGWDDYVSASAGGAETGTAKGDRNAYTLTLKTESASFPYEVDKSVLGRLS